MTFTASRPVSILPSGGDVPIDLRYQLIGVSRAVHERGHVRLVEGARIGHVERAQVGRPDDRTARIAVRLLPRLRRIMPADGQMGP